MTKRICHRHDRVVECTSPAMQPPCSLLLLHGLQIMIDAPISVHGLVMNDKMGECEGEV